MRYVGQNVLIILLCILQNVSFHMRHFVLNAFFVGTLCQDFHQSIKYHEVTGSTINIISGIVIALMVMNLFIYCTYSNFNNTTWI